MSRTVSCTADSTAKFQMSSAPSTRGDSRNASEDSTERAAELAEQLVDLVQQRDRAERLDEVLVGPGRAAPRAVRLAAACGEHDDPHCGRVRIALEQAAHVQAIALGHIDIEQDEVR